jgi:hypothetical protein
MFDVLKNNKYIIGALTLAFFLIFLIVFILFSRDTTNPVTDENPVFSDTPDRTPEELKELLTNPGKQWTSEGAETGTKPPLLRALTSIPVAGASIFSRTENGTPVPYARYTSHTNGHIFETSVATIGAEKILSNNTTLRIGEVFWSKKGSATVTRYLNENATVILSYVGRFTSTHSTTSEQTAEGLEESFTGSQSTVGSIAFAFSPTKDEYFYLTKNSLGSKGFIVNMNTGSEVQVWSSLLTNLSVSWNSENTILIYTNPSSITDGVVWKIDTKTNQDSVILEGEYALAAKSDPTGERILYSIKEQWNNIFSLRIFDIESSKTTKLPLTTIVEKCAWGGAVESRFIYCAIPNSEISGNFLEDWYMGLTKTNDTLWRIDTKTGVVKQLVDPNKEIQQELDIVDIAVSPEEDYLVFRSRGNNILWALTLPEKTTTEEATSEYDDTVDE